jgi:RNA polymerase sigma factor (TIGR02999 family)
LESNHRKGKSLKAEAMQRVDGPMNDFTLILKSAAHGDSDKSEALLPLIYEELRKLARIHMLREFGNHTLQATALVHEAWLRMVADGDRTWQNRASFYSAASIAMRRILVEHARRKSSLKRGGHQQRLDIDELELAGSEKEERILLVDEALELLEKVNPQRAEVVVLKFFGGMTNEEVAETLDIAKSSVVRRRFMI